MGSSLLASHKTSSSAAKKQYTHREGGDENYHVIVALETHGIHTKHVPRCHCQQDVAQPTIKGCICSSMLITTLFQGNLKSSH